MDSKQPEQGSNQNESGSQDYKGKWFDLSRLEAFDWIGIIFFFGVVKQIFFN